MKQNNKSKTYETRRETYKKTNKTSLKRNKNITIKTRIDMNKAIL